MVTRENFLYKWLGWDNNLSPESKCLDWQIEPTSPTLGHSHTFLINGYHLIHSVSAKRKGTKWTNLSQATKGNWNWGYQFIGTFDHVFQHSSFIYSLSCFFLSTYKKKQKIWFIVNFYSSEKSKTMQQCETLGWKMRKKEEVVSSHVWSRELLCPARWAVLF